MRKVLVTGGSGFLGPHVATRLKEMGFEVTIFDLRPPLVGFPWRQGDLTDLEGLVEATKGLEAVCHLGGVGDVYLAAEQPYLAASGNVTGTANLMAACCRNGVGRVVYASTWEVYGKPIYQPMDELHPCDPDHPYNITKLAGERIALWYDKLKGVEVVSLRLGTAYGEGMRPNSVFPIFINNALGSQPLVIKGTGDQSRQFTHVRDIADAFARAITAPVHGEAFNIVAPEEVSVRRLAQLIASEVPAPMVFEESRPGDIAPARVSSDKARRLLGWEARVPFGQGLSELISYYRMLRSKVAAPSL